MASSGENQLIFTIYNYPESDTNLYSFDLPDRVTNINNNKNNNNNNIKNDQDLVKSIKRFISSVIERDRAWPAIEYKFKWQRKDEGNERSTTGWRKVWGSGIQQIPRNTNYVRDTIMVKILERWIPERKVGLSSESDIPLVSRRYSREGIEDRMESVGTSTLPQQSTSILNERKPTTLLDFQKDFENSIKRTKEGGADNGSVVKIIQSTLNSYGMGISLDVKIKVEKD